MSADKKTGLETDGARVIGTCATVSDALIQISQTEHLDAAILDINLRGTTSYEIADVLRACGVQLAFVTGYDRSVLPVRYADISVCEKCPVSHASVRMR